MESYLLVFVTSLVAELFHLNNFNYRYACDLLLLLAKSMHKTIKLCFNLDTNANYKCRKGVYMCLLALGNLDFVLPNFSNSESNILLVIIRIVPSG
jgi:hypothetical protein